MIPVRIKIIMRNDLRVPISAQNTVETILLIEDDRGIAELVREKLGERGRNVICVESGNAARAWLAHHHPQLIVLDYSLPDMTGAEFVTQMGSMPPFIVATGAGDEGIAVAMMKRGARDYLIKDSRFLDNLPAVVEHILKDVASEHELAEVQSKLRESESSFQGILQSTADGILAISNASKVLFANQRFMEMWRVPAGLMTLKDDGALIQHVLDQLVDPQAFLQKLQELYRSKDESFDTLYFKDGRVFERLSQPLMQQDDQRGRVWSFRDITERRQSEKLQDAIYRIAQAADQAESLELLYPAIHSIVKEVMVAENFYIALYDQENDLISFPYAVDEADPQFPPQKPGKGMTEYVLRTRQSILVDESVYLGLIQRGEIELVGAHSAIWLGVPLVIEGQAFGVMAVQDYQDARVYGKREQHILEFVSSQVAMVIHRKQSDEALRVSEERFHSMFEKHNAVMLLIEPYSGSIIDANTAAQNYYGYPVETLKQMNIKEINILPPEEVAEHLRQALAENVNYFIFSHRLSSGEIRTVEVHSSPIIILGKPILFSVIHDITQRKQAELELQHSNQQLKKQLVEIKALQNELRELSIRDPLTGAYNRRYMEEMLKLEYARAQRKPLPVSIIILDIDHLKEINDTYGHLTGGDQALQSLAAMLREMCRAEDIICRYGGDEFLVILHNTPAAVAHERALQWREYIAQTRIEHNGTHFTITFSAGIAAFSPNIQRIEDVLIAADSALYAAKNAGRDCVKIFSGEIGAN